MEFTNKQIGIAVGAGVLLVLIFFGYLAWLNKQGPVRRGPWTATR